jgi:hypothetical protein
VSERARTYVLAIGQSSDSEASRFKALPKLVRVALVLVPSIGGADPWFGVGMRRTVAADRLGSRAPKFV